NVGLFVNEDFGQYGTLEARDLNTNMIQWFFYGDVQLQSSVMVVNGYVYVGSAQGRVWALKATSGQVVWAANVGPSIPYVDEQNLSQPLTGFAAGEGIIVIPTTTTLVAFEGDHTPTVTFDTPSPAPNQRGWNNTPVQVTFTPHAHPSGTVSTDPVGPLQFSSEGRY